MDKKTINIRTVRQGNLSIELLASDYFDKIKTDFTRIPDYFYAKKYITRSYQSTADGFYFELLNGKAIKLKNLNDFGKFREIDFYRISIPNNSNKVTYASRVAPVDFKALKNKINKIDLAEHYDFFGEFFRIENSSNVMVKWNPDFLWSKSKFSIFENLNTLQGITGNGEDLEKEINEEPFGKPRTFDAETYDIELITKNNKIENGGDFRLLLSNVFNIDEQKLDFTPRSFELLDTSLIWNIGVDHYQLINAFSAYVFDSINKYIDVNLVNYKYSDYISVQSKKSEVINLTSLIVEGIIDSGYCGSIKWVFDSLVRELK